MDNNELEIERIIMSNMLLSFDEGKYEDGCKLPSDNELAEKYNVPRMKIRHIYKRLESMGYVYSLQGRGRFFKGKRENIKLVLSGRESFSKK